MMSHRNGLNTRRTALSAVLAALSLLLLWLACLVPSGRLGMVALAGLVPAAAVVSAGLISGFLCYGTCGLLGLLLVPDKGAAALYLLFFGLYPMLKSAIERLGRYPLEWALKLLFFNSVLSIFWFSLRTLFLPFLPEALAGRSWPLYPVGNVAFLTYDFGFSKVISFYMERIDRAVRPK